MVMEYHKPGFLTAEVDKFTRLGTEHLQDGNMEEAREAFETAYRRAKQLDDGFTERACSFNLGAVYIAQKRAEKGLEYLQKAVPPMSQRDGKSNGDLFYNFGNGYALLKQEAEAVKYYELALEEYQSESDNARMEADVARHVGEIRTRLGQFLPAARAYNVAALAHAKLQEYEQRAVCLGQEAAMLIKAKKIDEAVAAADDCVILCQHVKQPELVGKLYNELGLMYTQCGDFFKSATCFEMALPLNRPPQGDKRREAIILQNLGAVYNSIGDYTRALPYHQQAAALHVELGSRNSQGQCFLNLAFAHSQMGDNDSAGECYLHALQAAKDTEDKKGEWQALEGLGAVAFNKQHTERAIQYFKSSLATLAESSENNAIAQERIVGKLTDALRYQLDRGPDDQRSSKAASVSSKPPSVIAETQSEPSRRQRRRDRQRNEKYSRGSKSHQSSGSDQLDVPNAMTPPVIASVAQNNQAAPVPGPSGSMYPHQTAAAPQDVRRRLNRPLLSTNTHNSEEEYKKIMRLKRRNTSSLGEAEVGPYDPRLEPPGTAEADSAGFRLRQARKKEQEDPSDRDLLNILKRLTRKVERGEPIDDEDVPAKPTSRPKSAKYRQRPQEAIDESDDYEDSENLHEAYAEQLEDSDEEEEEEEESDEEEEAEEEEEEEEEEEPVTRQATPPLPTSSPPNTLKVGTYETPVSASTSSPDNAHAGAHAGAAQEDNIPPPANYFRSDGSPKTAEGAARDKPPAIKVSVEVHGENEDDPIYHTIRTLRPEDENTQHSPGTSQEAGPSSQGAGHNSQEAGPSMKEPIREWEEESGPPTLPPMRVQQNMSRSEDADSFTDVTHSETEGSESESDLSDYLSHSDSDSKKENGEEFLKNVRMEHERNRLEREKSVDLPRQKQKSSRMCVVM